MILTGKLFGSRSAVGRREPIEGDFDSFDLHSGHFATKPFRIYFSNFFLLFNINIAVSQFLVFISFYLISPQLLILRLIIAGIDFENYGNIMGIVLCEK